jgi:hypothetical protein
MGLHALTRCNLKSYSERWPFNVVSVSSRQQVQIILSDETVAKYRKEHLNTVRVPEIERTRKYQFQPDAMQVLKPNHPKVIQMVEASSNRRRRAKRLELSASAQRVLPGRDSPSRPLHH